MAVNSIQAAGAVITRGIGTRRKYLLIHRNYRTDWTFPKGKVDPGEHVLAAAVREVREETGLAVRLGLPLGSARYISDGRPKTSHYWHATEMSGYFEPNDEVDEAVWVSLKEARDLLTYEHDRVILEAAALAVPSLPFVVLRHTQAMKRIEWAMSGKATAGVDQRRPLTAVGRMQANSLVPALAALGIDQVHASGSIRCRDTVGPYASARSITVSSESSLTEESHQFDHEAASRAISALAHAPRAVVVCTHRPVIPTVMTALAAAYSVTDPGKEFDAALTPGSMAVFHRLANDPSTLIAVERHKR